MAEGLSREHRAMVLAELERLEKAISEIATFLSMRDEDKSAIMLETAATDVAAAAWTLHKPMRTRPEGWLTGS